ncbi:hypothetical protein ACCC88_05695 [Sphingomonas sp. Sphisp140]|uniref:hypothetical protein n=1 Tax=unclassified Sphingomonas TaxID=196159 RepID=UPI0039AF5DDD
MKTLIGIVAALAVATGSKPAHSESFRLTCVGTGRSQGNEGVRKISETKYRIEGEGQQVSIRDGDYEFCIQGATCAVTMSSEIVQVQVRSVPHHDPGYTAVFHLDRKSLIFKASGGGLDGGWSITGKCKPGRS